MRRQKIILADRDENYLASLELKLYQELGTQADLEIITDEEYFEKYFSNLQSAELMFISEEFYHSALGRHNIKYMIVMEEEPDFINTDADNVYHIYKYMSLRDIYNKVLYICGRDLQVTGTSGNTQVLLVYSPSGECGKTTVALGLSACLEENYKKVLYIDAEYLQTFHHWTAQKERLPISGCFQRGGNDGNLFDVIKPYIRREGFDYLPPFVGALSALNIEYSVYEQIIQCVKKSREYDFIVVDTDCVFNKDKAALIRAADKVFLVYEQTDKGMVQMNALLENLDISDDEKFFLIRNKYSGSEIAAKTEKFRGGRAADGFIERGKFNCLYHWAEIAKLKGIRELAYMML